LVALPYPRSFPARRSSDLYGRVSRALHWGMALLLLWQFLSAGAHALLEDTSIGEFFWSTHKPLGFLLFILVFIRFSWAVVNLSQDRKSTRLNSSHVKISYA